MLKSKLELLAKVLFMESKCKSFEFAELLWLTAFGTVPSIGLGRVFCRAKLGSKVAVSIDLGMLVRIIPGDGPST